MTITHDLDLAALDAWGRDRVPNALLNVAPEFVSPTDTRSEPRLRRGNGLPAAACGQIIPGAPKRKDTRVTAHGGRPKVT